MFALLEGLERHLETPLERVELLFEAVQRLLDRMHRPRVTAASLHLELDGRLERVRHAVAAEEHLVVVEQLPAQAWGDGRFSALSRGACTGLLHFKCRYHLVEWWSKPNWGRWIRTCA